MRKIKGKLFLIIGGLTMTWFGICKVHWSSYRSHPEDCVVLDKISSGPGYKVSEKFYLILNCKDHVFDLSVSPATYSQARVGELLTFKLNEFEYNVNKRGRDNAVWFVIGIVTIVVVFIAIQIEL